MSKTIISLSGGVDSSTLLAYSLKHSESVMAFGFTYGSKHNSFENAAAKKVAKYYGIEYQLIDLCSVMRGFKSNLMSGQGEIPEGHYSDKSMSQTVVPGRNIIFLSILAGLAWSNGADRIAIGIHQGDHAIYPDCRPKFYDAMNTAIQEGTDQKVSVYAPFLNMDKAQVVGAGIDLEVPYELTRTCYKEQEIACGRCGSCVERLEAFKLNGIQDPVDYIQS